MFDSRGIIYLSKSRLHIRLVAAELYQLLKISKNKITPISSIPNQTNNIQVKFFSWGDKNNHANIIILIITTKFPLSIHQEKSERQLRANRARRTTTKMKRKRMEHTHIDSKPMIAVENTSLNRNVTKIFLHKLRARSNRQANFAVKFMSNCPYNLTVKRVRYKHWTYRIRINTVAVPHETERLPNTTPYFLTHIWETKGLLRRLVNHFN